jgi:hypothetical protein
MAKAMMSGPAGGAALQSVAPATATAKTELQKPAPASDTLASSTALIPVPLNTPGPHVLRADAPVRASQRAIAAPNNSGRTASRDHGATFPEFGSSDLHRQAELAFSEAAQPHLEATEDGFRAAQLEVSRAAMPSGGERGADGLRHEVSPRHDRAGTKR